MMLAECQPQIWPPSPQQRGGGDLKPFVALTPRGFKGRAFGPNPPLGASVCSGRGEKFLQWMELVPERFVLGSIGFTAFATVSFGSNKASQFGPETSGERDRTGKAIPPLSPERMAVRVSNRRSEIEKDRRRAACTDS